MIIRRLADVLAVEWGNGLSRRFLLESDGMGYSLTDTIVRAGTRSAMQYTEHLEACYCIAGTGELITPDGEVHRLEPGTMYALDRHDPHCLVCGPDEDLRLVCVFRPPLEGRERHDLRPDGYSRY